MRRVIRTARQPRCGGFIHAGCPYASHVTQYTHALPCHLYCFCEADPRSLHVSQAVDRTAS
ncbi:hypothetical protein AOX55_0000895 [Sinorhizobium fredii CCBAU 25509]|nr:hypothetical protein AOX55_0000895 [Sinorhizobium fredii CCBAU 25509]